MIGDGRMPAMRIIPPFNLREDGQSCLPMRTERSAINQLTLKGSEEALAQRVVIAVASRPIKGRSPPHTILDVVVDDKIQLLVRETVILCKNFINFINNILGFP